MLGNSKKIFVFLSKKCYFSTTMNHVFTDGFGDTSVLKIKQSPLPKIATDEVLVKIKATAINRADILQRQGKYPPPKGASDILGLEAAGYIVGENGNMYIRILKKFYHENYLRNENEPIMCLLGGGGYSQYAKVNKHHIIPVPKNISIEEAAGIPEVWLTAFLNLRILGKIDKSQNVMIYAGASGVGTAAIQIAQFYGSNAFFTCSTQDKMDFCLKLGGKHGFNYKKLKNNDIFEEISKITKGKLIDIILDCVGPQNFELSAKLANIDSRWILYGLLSGAKVDNFNLAQIVGKRVSLIGSTIRSRSDEYKTYIIDLFKKELYAAFEQKKVKPVIDQKLRVSWDEKGLNLIKEGHKYLEANKNIGKIILILD